MVLYMSIFFKLFIIFLLINGGDKSTQSKDIEKAKSILQEWRNLQ